MRILYVGNAMGFGNSHKFYLFPQRLNNGFTRCGHNVYIFNDRDEARHLNIWRSSKLGRKPMNARLLEVCRNFMPELIVLGHCEHVGNETLEEIRIICPGVKIIYRNVDPVDDSKNAAAIQNRSKVVDGIFVTTAGDVLKTLLAKDAKAFITFLPNPVDTSIDTGQAYAIERPETDLFFAASPLGPNDRRAVLMRQLLPLLPETLNTRIIGAGINDQKIFGSKFVDALSNAAMGLIVNKTEDYYLYASDRMSQYLGNGMLVFCHTGPRYSDLFDKGEIVEYETAEDLAEKIKYYQDHNDKRQKLARAGFDKARAMFDSTRIAQYMLDQTFSFPYHHDYEWPVTKYKTA